MQFILKVVRSKGYDALMAAIFGAIVGVIVSGIIYGLYRLIVVNILALATPSFVGDVMLPLIGLLIIFGHAVVGFGAGLGMFRRTKLGRFLYYGSSTSLVRGLFWQLVFTLLGMTLFNLFLIITGKPAPFLNEPALVFGAIVGVFGFVLGAGVLTDWILWMGGHSTPLRHGPPKGKPEWFRYFSVDVNHKVIGIQYGVASILVLLIGGLFAIIFRIELAQPGMQWLTFDQYNTLFSAHGIVMIASMLLGVGAMVNYLVPLMIGASDMAFPRLNAFSFWVAIPSVTLILGGMALGGWDTGWVGYPTLSLFTPHVGVLLFLLGFWINGFSSISGAINLLVTIAFMRAKGMTLFRMPIFVWGAIATALIQFTSTQTVGIALTMTVLERAYGLTFFNPANGGNPILYQHLFWFYSHPVVYLFVLPGLGVISELLPVFSRKPLFGYKWVAMSSLAIAFVGFLVWAHHMFVSGMDDALRIPFMLATMLVAVPTGVKFFSWVATIWGGKLSFETPMLFVLGAISVFLIGGVTGPILGTVPTNMQLHDSYWVVGHFHATMFGGFVFPFFAAIYYWYPKVTGRYYNERLGKIHFWLMVPGFWVMSFGQMSIGISGMRRRIADYDPALGIETGQILVTLAALVIGWSVLIMVYNLISSMRTQVVASKNPWRSRSPEWQTTSPVPEFNYDAPIEVVGDPYDYGLEGSTYVRMAPAPSGD
jgi:cytochrome c oxidase subunit 1